ncbi:MAG: hypothetical protein U5M23_12865 [Marinagarivorans sp.]|nr:hypothetical protein [Marinagarivorans sp.]
MAAAQRLSFAASFVSGYIYTNNSNPRSGATHAGAEAFLLGAGWKGLALAE